VPGGIGLTGWLGKTYAELGDQIVGGAHGMMEGFDAMLRAESKTDEPRAVVVVSDEAATYRPEMEWLESAGRIPRRAPGRTDEHRQSCRRLPLLRIIRFAQRAQRVKALMDAAAQRRGACDAAVQTAARRENAFRLSVDGAIARVLAGATRRQDASAALREVLPYTWILDPTPLPPHAVIPELNIHDWRDMAEFSQKQRELVLKISGFSDRAWGSRGVYVGHDLPSTRMGGGDRPGAGRASPTHPFILQRFEKSKLFDAQYVDFESERDRARSVRVSACAPTTSWWATTPNWAAFWRRFARPTRRSSTECPMP
jgi:hypothetical protein